MPNMVVVITSEADHLEQVLDAWERSGVSGISILESLGIHKVRQTAARDDIPLIMTLRHLVEAEEYQHHTLFAVVDDNFDLDGLIKATERAIGGDYGAPNTGILFVVPVTRVLGLRREPGQIQLPGGKDRP